MALLKSVRGDVNSIRVGNRVNIQDGSTLHNTFNGSVVLEKSILEPDSLYAGVPVKRLKTINPSRLENMIKGIARNYLTYADWYK